MATTILNRFNQRQLGKDNYSILTKQLKRIENDKTIGYEPSDRNTRAWCVARWLRNTENFEMTFLFSRESGSRYTDSDVGAFGDDTFADYYAITTPYGYMLYEECGYIEFGQDEANLLHSQESSWLLSDYAKTVHNFNDCSWSTFASIVKFYGDKAEFDKDVQELKEKAGIE